MKKTLQQLTDKYALSPASQKEFVTDGKKYIVTRHFTGDKNINKVIYGLAVSRAEREAGLI